MKTKLLLLVILLFAGFAVNAQSSAIDSSFGNHGVLLGTAAPEPFFPILHAQGGYPITLDEIGGPKKILKMEELSSSKVMVLGESLARINSNGSIDSSFGQNGLLDSSRIGIRALCIKVQADQKIVLGGYIDDSLKSKEIALARLNSNGSLDTSFGVNGIVIPTYAQTYHNDLALSLDIQSDGKIIVGGSNVGFGQYSYPNAVLFRLNSNGTKDSSFSFGAQAQNTIWSLNAIANIHLYKNQRIILSGPGYRTLNSNLVIPNQPASIALPTPVFSILALDYSGSLDTNFASAGRLEFSKSGLSQTAMDSSGRIKVLTEQVQWGANWMSISRVLILRGLTAMGKLDSTFGINSKSTFRDTLPSLNWRFWPPSIQSFQIDKEQRLVYSGAIDSSFQITRLQNNGMRDSSCSWSDISYNLSQAKDEPFGMLIKQNGNILLAGIGNSTSSGYIQLLPDWNHNRTKLTASACDEFSFYGNTYTSDVNTSHMLTSNGGCDSLIMLDLKLQYSDSIYHPATNCYSYSFLNTTYAQSGHYTDTLQNIHGCDSVIHLDLVIHPLQSTIHKDVNCESYTFNGRNYLATGNYVDTFQSVHGCDSLVLLDLTIHHSDSSRLTDEACDLFWFNGISYSQTGTYIDTLQTQYGCDSIVTLDISVTHIDSTVTQTGTMLSAQDSGTSYQWIHCATGFPINGANSKSFNATQNGDYAVEITKGNCTEVSACYSVRSVGMDGHYLSVDDLKVYPNPSNGNFTIDLVELKSVSSIEILNIQGQVVYTSPANNELLKLNLNLPKGVYQLRANHEKGISSRRVILE